MIVKNISIRKKYKNEKEYYKDLENIFTYFIIIVVLYLDF